MRIVLFGKSGQVGWELQRSLAPLGEVIALDFDSTDYCGDFTRPDEVARTVAELAPQLVVNAAAHTAVDKAESEPDLAHTLNAEAPGAVARAAHAAGAWMVHYSTDYVFSGAGTRPWTESDATGPLSVYGRTKLAGEQAVAAHCQHHLILRTSWVYAARGGNFARTMLRLAAERERLTVVDDQHGAPTGADLLADLTAHMARAAMSRPELAGTYHAVADGHTTWHGYASHVIGYARQAGAQLKVREIVPVPSSAFPTPAQRPANSRLDTTRLRNAFRLSLPDWRQGVTRMLNEIL